MCSLRWPGHTCADVTALFTILSGEPSCRTVGGPGEPGGRGGRAAGGDQGGQAGCAGGAAVAAAEGRHARTWSPIGYARFLNSQIRRACGKSTSGIHRVRTGCYLPERRPAAWYCLLIFKASLISRLQGKLHLMPVVSSAYVQLLGENKVGATACNSGRSVLLQLARPHLACSNECTKAQPGR